LQHCEKRRFHFWASTALTVCFAMLVFENWKEIFHRRHRSFLRHIWTHF
jgi:hypothetical protein